MTASATAQPAPRFDGPAITLGGVTYTVPALGLLGLQKGLPILEQLADAASAGALLELLDPLCDLVHVSLLRNYPALPREEVALCLELANLPAAIDAVLQANGFARRPEGAMEDPAGNGGAPQPPSTGAPSTAA